ncbi:alpha-2-macroglobulin family protein [Stakelama marina]|uniref:Alpha-2-macroglobulin n=1 Tax=Stakelama marina TaxID=2826939 RepID=A0A8T4IHF5_9SPHN|nr:MG2 domain-containing protein [Stakelama marina]MBR0553314.1 alpha-2-macroglobulin [Stakelama marina]
MKLVARIVFALLALMPVLAFGDAAPRVILSTPGVSGGAIARFTIRFSDPMVPLGDPRSAPPVTTKCKGQGRWVDQRTFVYDFAKPLPGGVTCGFDLVDGLKSLKGYAVAGTSHFEVDSGGPVARSVLPSAYGSEIDEDQVFLIAANLPADPVSVAENAYCAVDGIGEKIPVDVLKPELAGDLLTKLGPNRWQVRSFLERGGIAEDLPDDPKLRGQALSAVTALKCRRPLPPGRDMALVWGAGIKSKSGRVAGTDQRFDYEVRKPFTARFECSRVNPQAGCNPLTDAHVRFSARVPRSKLAGLHLEFPDGRKVAPTLSDDDKRHATLSDLTFKAPLPVDTTAKLVLPAAIRDLSGRGLANAERFPLDIRIDEAPPLVKFAAPFGILEAKEGGVLPVTVRGVEPVLQGMNRNLRATGKSLRVAGSDGAVAEWLRKVDKAGDYKVETVTRNGKQVRINRTGENPVLTAADAHRFTLKPAGKGKAFEVVGIPLGKPGFYVVELASPALGRALLGRDQTRYVATAALVTNMAVHFKWGRANSLAWITSLDSGKPVGGADVRVTDSCTGKLLAHGRTDGEGRLLIPDGLPEPDGYGSCERKDGPHPLMVSARSGGDYSFTLTNWDKGIAPYDFELPFGYSSPEPVFHTIFDRALVRQGETIHMKHIVRKQVAKGFAVEGGMKGTLRLSHRGSDTQFDLPVTIDARGVGESMWHVPQGAPMGEYDLRFIIGDKTIWTDQTFRVDEYRLPTMKATVSGPKEAQVKPHVVPLDLYVGYLSGGGAANLPVETRVGYFETALHPDGYEDYSFSADKVTEGVQPLNGDNEVDETNPLPPTQTMPITLKGDGTARVAIDVPQTVDQPTNMLVEMDYPDANGEVLTASRRIPLYTSGVQLGIRTDGWMMRADDLRLKFIALDTDGKPLKDKKVSVALYSREILTARRRLIGGFYAYDNQRKTTRLDEGCTATTDKLGRAECKLDPGLSGEIYAVATTTDAAGNVARAGTSVWLAGDDDWWFGGDNGDRMDVIPEQQEYKAGETARFQVRMPFRQATALVTVEREGVLSSFVTKLSGKDPVVEVPMPGAYAPDVYVSVLAVRGRVGGWRLWLADLARRWHLPFFSRDVAKPTATVDLAKPAYRLGIAKVKVGWDAHRLNVRVAANETRYSPRDTASVAFQVLTPDGKAARNADVAFVAVDEALLQLAPNDSWDVLKAMMGDRPLSVLTSTAQMQVVGKRHYGRKAVAAGGGGGGGDLSGLNRENFKPVLLWKGHVPLDQRGIGRIRVPLSDALSSFRLVAIATDGDGMFGTGQTTVRTAQDLSIFSGVPPLVRTGDFVANAFTLRNGSDHPMKVTATVAVNPRVATGHPLTVTIPPGGAAPVAWNMTVPEGIDQLTWQVSARDASGRSTDRLSVTQKVIPAVPVETWSSTLTRASGTIAIAPPGGALPGRGDVTVALSDTLAPPLTGVRSYMAEYPYGCFEQKLSQAVALGDQQAWRGLAAEIPVYLDRDGLLRYFPSDQLQGSEALTAYVLSLTAEAGLEIPDGPRGRMLDGMRAVLDGRLRHEDYGDVRLQRVAAFAALARQGAASADMLGQIGLPVTQMPTASLADYLMALGKVPGLANGPQLRVEAEAELRKRLAYEGTRLDITDSEDTAWWLMASNDESAIKAMMATMGRPGWNEDTPKMMVGVAQRLRHGHWDTTTANAWGSVAVRNFMRAYPAEAIAGVTTASLGGQSVSRKWPVSGNARTLRLPLPENQSRLTLSQAGGAAPWALVSVRAAVPLKQPVAAGYRMTRRVEVVQARTPGKLTRGDVVKVTISVNASAARSWVVIDDPVPAGATIVSNLGGQSQMLGGEGGTSTGISPSYVERGQDSWRAYYGWMPEGDLTVSYVMRLNGAGHFNLPPTRVEAMYSPAIHAAVPNQPMTVAQR